MTDEQRPPLDPASPDGPDAPTAEPRDPGQEEFSSPDGDEFDGGRGGVTPEFPGDERPAPDGAPATDIPAPPDDPGAVAVDDHAAGEPGDLGHQAAGGPDPAADREHLVDREPLNAPNQGFRPGG
jgi:hypothetical protein